MNSAADLSLAERRHILRQQLLAQRQRIARQLEPVREIHSNYLHSHYPRSMTMRFLMQRPDLLARLLPKFVTSGTGARLVKLIIVALTLFRIIQATSRNQAVLLSAPRVAESGGVDSFL